MGHSQNFGLQWRLKKSLMLQMKGKLNPLFEMSKLFDRVILLLRQAMNSCSYIRHFNFLMFFVGDKKRVESMLKDSATAFTDAENILFGPKYEELVEKSLSSKNRSKELFGSIKNKDHPRREIEGSPFERTLHLEAEEIEGEEFSQLLVKPYNNNILPEDNEGVRMNSLIAPSISLTDLLPALEFFKIHLLVDVYFR